jgi:hypothetical protein
MDTHDNRPVLSGEDAQTFADCLTQGMHALVYGMGAIHAVTHSNADPVMMVTMIHEIWRATMDSVEPHVQRASMAIAAAEGHVPDTVPDDWR